MLYIDRKGETYEALIDTEDLPKLLANGRSWCIQYIQGTGAMYVKDSKQQYLHRLIMDNPTGMVVDHIHFNTLDNRKSQLRVLPHAENIRHTKGAYTSNRTSGYKNVTWSKKYDKWHVKIMHNYTRYSLGYTDDLVEAVMRASAGRNKLRKPSITRVPIHIREPQ